jgi:general stress protein 26
MCMNNDTKQCIETLKEFRTAMLVTKAEDDAASLRARPLHIARIDDDGTMYFVTAIESSAVGDILESNQSLVTLTGGSTYAVASGQSRIRKDLLDDLWSKEAALWFENGKDEAAVVEFIPTNVEVWNQKYKGLEYAFEAALAALAGESNRADKTGDHVTANLA